MGNIPGMGVMIQRLFGHNGAEVLQAALGKSITALSLGDDDALHFIFADGSKLKLSDEGQSCCESRYMRTDDTLSDFIGATLDGVELREAPDVTEDDNYGETHEVQFLVVKTSAGQFTMSSHNEHNGYYGGFAISAAAE